MSIKTHTRTPEQRKAEALHQSIIDQVEQLADSGQWHRFLDFARSFRTYSLNNLLLILAQKPDATMVAGFRQWQAKGRQVRRGEKAINIFGYSQTKSRAEAREDDEAREEEAPARAFFPVLSVFDIAQTEPIEGAEPMPENPTQRLLGEFDGGIVEQLSLSLTASGWTVTREVLAAANGYTDPDTRAVLLACNLAPAQEAKTLIHEAAHIELGHIADLDAYRQHRGRMEVEAESVAYIVAGLHGIDTSAYSICYIAGWSFDDVELIRSTASRVLSATRSILDLIEANSSCLT